MNEEQQTVSPCKGSDLNLKLPETHPQKKGNRPGDLCPKCHTETLDYNGLMLLVCPLCGQIEGGCFT